MSCVVDLAQVGCPQLALKVIATFDGALPGMPVRAADQALATRADQVARNVASCRKERGLLIWIQSVSNDALQESDSFADCGSTSFDLRVKPSITFLISCCSHGQCAFLAGLHHSDPSQRR
jgi:hypothetical protein